MNFLFGQVGADRSLLHPDAELRVGAAYGRAAVPFAAIPNAQVWSGTDEGSVLGRAEDSGATLAYLGTIPRGVPGWTDEASPIDDPDKTAAFLLAAYRNQGSTFLDGVPGSYIVVVADREKSALFVGADPAGSHSLFIYRHATGLAFASNLGVLRRGLPGLELDRSMEDFLLGYQFLPGGRTIYRGVTVLPGGTLLELRDGQESHHSIKGWSETVPDLSAADEVEINSFLYQGFMQALEDVAPTSKKVAVVLGGFDSALVASGLKSMGREVHTYTFHFDVSAYNQSHTDTLTQYAGTTHHPVEINQTVIADGLAQYGSIFNQTSVHPNNPIQHVELCRRIRRDGLSHAVTGDGCDGLFLGYPSIYKRARIISNLSKVPNFVWSVANRLSRSRLLEARLGHPYRVYRNVLDILKRDPLVRDHFGARALDSFSLKWARGGGVENGEDVEQILTELAVATEHLSPLRRAYHSKALGGSNRTKMEACLDVTGVAMTSPYTHPRFAKMAGSLSDEHSRPEKKGQGKAALMRMADMSELLPKEIIYQPKRSPVEAPVDRWYKGALRSQIELQLANLPFKVERSFTDSLFTHKLAERMFGKYVTLDDLATPGLMALVTYAAFTGPLDASDT